MSWYRGVRQFRFGLLESGLEWRCAAVVEGSGLERCATECTGMVLRGGEWLGSLGLESSGKLWMCRERIVTVWQSWMVKARMVREGTGTDRTGAAGKEGK